MVLQSPSNYVFVSVKTKWTAHISNIMKVAQIENNSSVDSSDVVSITGVVQSLPIMITENIVGFEGFSTKDIRIGDTAIFSSNVINDIVMDGEEDIIYRNRCYHQTKEYFAVDIREVFGVIREEKIIMINGWVMIEPFEESKIIIPQHLRKTKNAVKSNIIAIGNPRTTENRITAKTGDRVYFNSMKAAKYQINGKKFCILHQNQILGRDIEKHTKIMPPPFTEN